MPISRLKLMSGMQKAINFYFNSHMLNVRKSLNNLFIADPKSVNMHDVLNPHGGKVIRTRKAAWGRGVKDSIEQLRIDDITANHMNDLSGVRGLNRELMGTVDSIQGVQRTGGERVTAEEFRSTRMGALSKLAKAARIISLQSMQDLGIMYAYHTQQFMSQQTYVDTAGRWQDQLTMEYGIDGRVPVTPFDLNIAFDIEVHDGSIQGGEFVEAWTRLYEIMLAHPETVQSLDATRIFMHVARLMGVRNPQDFLKKQQGGGAGGQAPNLQVLPDQQVLEDQNLIPLEAAGG